MEQNAPPEGWNRPKPEVISEPTWWPAALAFGATLFVWGLVTSIVILIIGAVVTIISLIGWIGDIRHEQKRTE
jgi:hypothetical protein